MIANSDESLHVCGQSVSLGVVLTPTDRDRLTSPS